MRRTTTTLNQLPDRRPTEIIDATMILDGASGIIPDDATEAMPPLDNPGFAEHFDFICHFASGGVGAIGKARDRMLDRVVAVKSLKPEYRDDPEVVASFLRECRLNARLEHPSIVPIYDLGRNRDGVWSAAMKFIDGASLKEFLATTRRNYDKKKRVKPFQEQRALITRLEYFIHICEVIEYIHSMNIVHGDLKPDNIMLGRFGELYVMDWGCARQQGSRPRRLSGTPDYLPPEFLTAGVVTFDNDLYALGMILFELVTLLHGRNRISRAGEPTEPDAASCPIAPVSAYRHYLPGLAIDRRLKAIIYKAVHPDPKQRYGSVAELASDVRHFIYHEEVSAAPDGPIRQSARFLLRHRITAITGGILFVLLLVLGWTYTAYRAELRDRERDIESMRQLRLQSYTDIIFGMVTRNLLEDQTLLLLFADNLLENTLLQPPPETCLYADSAYRDAATAPEGMITTPLYPHPVNFSTLVFLGDKPDGAPRVSAEDFIRICRKILQYEPGRRTINPQRSNSNPMLSSDNPIQRLIAIWRNGAIFSYPGTYEDPANAAYAKRFFPPTNTPAIAWSIPYAGVTGKHRMLAGYPLFDEEHRFLGEARLEFRLEVILEPLLRANAKDPVHRLYFIAADGTVLTAEDRQLRILPEREASPEKMDAATLKAAARQLRNQHMEQFIIEKGDRRYHVSGNLFKLLDAMLIQMIDVKAMKHHEHVDLSL